MPIAYIGPTCARRGCTYPIWKDALCNRCWRLARFIEKPPELFAYEPLNGYSDPRDAVALPWERWEQDARERGVAVADLLAERPAADSSKPRRPER